MKKLSTVIITIFVIVGLLSGCASTKLANSFDKDTVVKVSKQVISYLNVGDYASACGMLQEDLQDDLTQDQLKEAVKKTYGDAGKFIKYKNATIIGQKNKTLKEDSAVAVIVAKYEKKKVIFTISFNKDMKMISLYMR